MDKDEILTLLIIGLFVACWTGVIVWAAPLFMDMMR